MPPQPWRSSRCPRLNSATWSRLFRISRKRSLNSKIARRAIAARCGKLSFIPRELAAMIRYRKLGYVELMVTDLERSAAFYRDIVALEPAAGGPAAPRPRPCSDAPPPLL